MTDYRDDPGGDGDEVFAAFACPSCGERDMDILTWVDDEVVRCWTCGATYVPGEGLTGRN
jgi:hypothetical protein